MTYAEQQKIINRLKRAEGQMRGIQNMVSADKSIEHVFVQIRAIKSALCGVESALIESNLRDLEKRVESEGPKCLKTELLSMHKLLQK